MISDNELTGVSAKYLSDAQSNVSLELLYCIIKRSTHVSCHELPSIRKISVL